MSEAKENPGATILGEELTTTGATTSTTEETTTTPDQGGAVDYLTQLVGEGKKYKTVADLAKAYANADPYIETLKGEVATLREEVAKAKTVEDIMGLITPRQTEVEPPPMAKPQATPNGEVDLDAWYAAKEQERIAKAEEEKKIQEIKATQQESWKKLSEAYGGIDKAKQVVSKILQDDGAMSEVIDRLGSYSPDKFVAFVQTQVPREKPVSFSDAGGVNLNLQDAQKGLTWSKCKEVKKSNLRLFNTQKFQLAMQNAQAANPNFFKE